MNSPQPPPDVPAPPPGPEAIRSRRIRKWILAVRCLALVFMLLPLVSPQGRGHEGFRASMDATMNLRQIGLLLFAFEEEYGRFPDVTTIPAVQAATGTSLTLGNSSSNDLFRQLLANSHLRSERDFWAKTATSPKKPNNTLGADALAPGECAFTYIAGLTSTGDPETPIVMAPVIRGTWKFDREAFDGKAIVLRLNSSATRLPINKNGDVIINGMNLFDPRQPFWRAKAPDIKYPE